MEQKELSLPETPTTDPKAIDFEQRINNGEIKDLHVFFNHYFYTSWKDNGEPFTLKKNKHFIQKLSTETHVKIPERLTFGRNWLTYVFNGTYFCLAQAMIEVDPSCKEHINFERINNSTPSIVHEAQKNNDWDMLNFWMNVALEKSEQFFTPKESTENNPEEEKQLSTQTDAIKTAQDALKKSYAELGTIFEKARNKNDWESVAAWADKAKKECEELCGLYKTSEPRRRNTSDGFASDGVPFAEPQPTPSTETPGTTARGLQNSGFFSSSSSSSSSSATVTPTLEEMLVQLQQNNPTSPNGTPATMDEMLEQLTNNTNSLKP